MKVLLKLIMWNISGASNILRSRRLDSMMAGKLKQCNAMYTIVPSMYAGGYNLRVEVFAMLGLDDGCR
jgi:hypothetical protein